jgi:hypothetical protein
VEVKSEDGKTNWKFGPFVKVTELRPMDDVACSCQVFIVVLKSAPRPSGVELVRR